MGFELLELTTVGLPFCGFKILAGICFNPLLTVLGVLDLVVNVVNLVGLVALKRRPLPACCLALLLRVVRGPRWQELGTSIDVLVSFAIVALMIGAGALGGLNPMRLQVWNVCVILNVLGAGLGRVSQSWRDLASKPQPAA